MDQVLVSKAGRLSNLGHHSDTHQWIPTITGDVIARIDVPNSTFYVGPFAAGAANVLAALVRIYNDGNVAGTIYWKLFEYPGTPDEAQINSGEFVQAAGGYWDWDVLALSIPPIIGDWPLGFKCWGETETEPGWGMGLGKTLLGQSSIGTVKTTCQACGMPLSIPLGAKTFTCPYCGMVYGVQLVR